MFASKIALGIKAVTMLFVTLSIYFQDLAIVTNEAVRSELMSYILVIPFLLTYLLYRKRKMLRATIPFKTTNPTSKLTFKHEIVGALLCLTAFLLYWHGSYTFQPLEYHMVSLPLFTAGLTLIILNMETLRVLAFPIAFLLFLAPPPLETIYVVGANLSAISSEAAYDILKAVGLPVSLGNQYGSPVIILQKPEGPLSFAIDIACSGIYSLIGFMIFTVFATYIARGPVWKKATLFITGFPLMYGLNIGRIIVIILIGNQSGMEVAVQAFHLLGGLVLIFMGTLIFLAISEKIFKMFTAKPRTTPCNHCNQNPPIIEHFCPACGKLLNPMDIRLSRRDLSKILVFTMGAVLIVNLQVPVFALTKVPAEVTLEELGNEQTVAQILPEIQGYATRFIYRDERFEEIAKQDASLLYAYMPTDETKMPIFIAVEIARTRSSLHRWEVCLITYPLDIGLQPQVQQLSLRDIQILQDPPITARYFAFQRRESNLTQQVLYWYENADFKTSKGLEKEYVKISLVAFAQTPEDIRMIEEQLLAVGQAIANHWQPIKTWSQISLIIAQHGNILITISAAALAITLALQVIEKQKEKRSNFRVYSRLASDEEKLQLRAVYQAAKDGNPTTDGMASCYRRLSGRPIESSLLLQKLNEAEKAGLLRREIVSRDDEPVLVWKSNVSL